MVGLGGAVVKVENYDNYDNCLSLCHMKFLQAREKMWENVKEVNESQALLCTSLYLYIHINLPHLTLKNILRELEKYKTQYI